MLLYNDGNCFMPMLVAPALSPFFSNLPAQDDNPTCSEDVGSVCKLFKVLGHKLDNNTRCEFRDRVHVYIERMKVLAEDQSLEEE